MSRTIDERVVSMRFDNKHFESNVQTTMSTLEKLKSKLNLTGATKGLETVDAAAKKVDMSTLGTAIETVQTKFSALQIMGVTALVNLTNSAINAGKRIVSALTIDPIKTGFSEYETQIGAVQTILANTESKGSTLQDVNRALDELNTYADKTIYNFTEMTRNIGTFTAAGVGLDTSVSAIKGIANLAAVSGSTSQQASTAMYQLSQALAAGRVTLMDWNSVVNASMGGQVFQDALKRTSEVLGTGAEAAIKKFGSFRESLTQGEWLTVDVLTETLKQFTMAAEEGSDQWELYKKSLMDDGYTEKQALEILKMANTATDAATKVKTFTQLWDTLKESAQSGWTQTWEIIVGDFGEAKETLTKISDTIGGMIGASSDARNSLLSGGLSSGWKQLLDAGIADEAGYVDMIKTVAKERGTSIDDMIKAEKELDKSLTDNEAFQKVLKQGLTNGSISSDILTTSISKLAEKMTKMSAAEREAAGYTDEHVLSIKELNEGLKNGTISIGEFVTKITHSSGRQNLIDALWNSFNAVLAIIKPIKEAFSEVFPAMTGDQLYSITEKIKDFTSKLMISGETANDIKRLFKGLFSIFKTVGDAAVSVVKVLGGFLKGDTVAKVVDLISSTIASFGDLFSWIGENVDTTDIFAGLASGGIVVFAKKISDAIGNVSESITGFIDSFKVAKTESLTSKIGGAFDSIGESLQSFVAGIKIGSLLSIAISVGVLAASLSAISELKPETIVKSLTAIGVMFRMLTVSFRNLSKNLDMFKPKGIVKSAFSLILIAKAIDVLSKPIEKLGKLSLEELGKGLGAVAIALAEMIAGLKFLDGVKINLRTSVAMLALAEACKKLGDALVKFAKLSWDEIARGLTAMGGALAEFVIALKVLDKTSGFKSLMSGGAMWLAVQSLDELSENLKKFGEMDWDDIGRGLTAMGGALTELGVTVGLLGHFTGFSGVLGGGALVMGAESLDEMADSLKKFGTMQWDDIGRGLAAMGGALVELGLTVGLLGYFTGFSGILGGAALWVGVQALDELAEALKKFGTMAWDEIGKGLTAMGGALTELGLTVGLLGGFTNVLGILGGAALWIGIQGLDDLAVALKKFGEMDWDEIARGLTAMGGALAVVAGGTFLNTLSIIGSLTLETVTKPLSDLADALKKYGEMDWDEIGKGLTAMGGALAVVAGGSFVNTIGIIGSFSIEKIAKPLGDLADSVKKWKDVEVPLSLGLQLSNLASGVFAFTFDGLGAHAIATVAKPLGDLADSVKKWTEVVVPDNLSSQLTALSGGVFSFSLGGLGASTIEKVSKPLGDFAGSVSKWSEVVIPTTLAEDLTDLAGAIDAFSLAFVGGWALSEIKKPFSDFTEAIKKWDGVTIPTNLAEDLAGLADAILDFSLGFLAGASIDTITEPLGDLADSIKKFEGVEISYGLATKLKDIAEALKSYAGFTGNITNATEGFGKIADGITKINGIKMDTISSDLTSLADGLTTFANSTESLTDVGDTIVKNIVEPLNSSATQLEAAGSSMVDSISKGVGSNTSGLTSTMSTAISNMIKSIRDKQVAIRIATNTLVNALLTTIRSSYNSFYSAGAYLVDGFAAGINANRYKAAAKAQAMASAAAEAAKKELEERSPSRVGYEIGDYFGIAFVNAIGDYADKAYDASTNVASQAKDGLRNAISNLANMINSEMDTQPTIRPVLDLSDVSSGAYAINSMLSMSPSVGVLSNVGSIGAMMNSRQNGTNDDVISAINGLKKSLGNMSGDTYNINGITYDDGSNVSYAVKSLIRAAKMEGRS